MVGLMVISAAKMVVLCVFYGDFTSKTMVIQPSTLGILMIKHRDLTSNKS
jgi:hypothetical protein